MAVERIRTRVAYLVGGRVGGQRSMGPHAVSEECVLAVPVAEAGDHPVAGSIVREPHARDRDDAGGTGPGRAAQRIEFRECGDGLLCPVTEPGGLVPLRVDRIPHVEAAIRAMVARKEAPHLPSLARGRNLALSWTGHPALPHGGPRPWKSLDREATDIRGIASDGRPAALARAAAAMAACRVIDGVLWRPCGPPMWIADRGHDMVRVHAAVPGLDMPMHDDPEMRGGGLVSWPSCPRVFAVAPCDVDPRAFGASLLRPGVEGEVDVPHGAPDHPAGHMRAEVDAQRLDCLHGTFAHDMGGMRWTDVPVGVRMQVVAVDDALRRHRAGTLGSAEAMALVAGPLRDIAAADAAPPFGTGPGRDARAWTAVEAMAPRPAAEPGDPAMAAFRP